MTNHKSNHLPFRITRLFLRALLTCAFYLAAATAYCNILTPGLSESQRPFTLPKPLRGRIETGLSANLSYMKAQHQTLYPLWPRERVNQFAIIDDKKFFYNGLFYANLSMLADVTGVKFELGLKPQLVAIFGEHLRSWQDVNTFLETQNTSFRIQDSMTTSIFTGCNKIQYSDNGTVRLAILIVDITEDRDSSQIDRCIFSQLISTFGFETDLQSKNIISELSCLRVMYTLDDSERDGSKIVDEILRRVQADQ